MSTNNFLQFCPTDSGTNLDSQSDYAVATDRTNGNQPGIARSKLVNKALRQANFITSQVAQYLANTLGVNVLDDADNTKLQAQMNALLYPIAPAVQTFLTGSGTWNKTYHFTITSGSATTGATYTNNSVTFTVVDTVASATVVRMTGSGAPTLTGGTLTKSGGTGDSTLTFSSVRIPIYLRVRAVGGGGGGAGSGTGNTGGAGSDGSDTTLGGTVIVAGKGFGAPGTSGGAGTGGNGGTASITSAAKGIVLGGGVGGSGGFNNTTPAPYTPGGMGAGTAFGGAGANNNVTSGSVGVANTGAGGGGGGSSSVASVTSGGGGGAGAYVDVIISAPSATYAYVVGAGGTLGSAGTSGQTGAAGGAGMIVVEEHYQ